MSMRQIELEMGAQKSISFSASYRAERRTIALGAEPQLSARTKYHSKWRLPPVSASGRARQRGHRSKLKTHPSAVKAFVELRSRLLIVTCPEHVWTLCHWPFSILRGPLADLVYVARTRERRIALHQQQRGSSGRR
jgi:hypothetical protein